MATKAKTIRSKDIGTFMLALATARIRYQGAQVPITESDPTMVDRIDALMAWLLYDDPLPNDEVQVPVDVGTDIGPDLDEDLSFDFDPTLPVDETEAFQSVVEA